MAAHGFLLLMLIAFPMVNVVLYYAMPKNMALPDQLCQNAGFEERCKRFRDSLVDSDREFVFHIPPLSQASRLANQSYRLINPSAAVFQGVLLVASRLHAKIDDVNWVSDVLVARFELKTRTQLSKFESAIPYTLPPLVQRCMFLQAGHFITGPADPRIIPTRQGELYVSYSFYASSQPTWREGHTNAGTLLPCELLDKYSSSMWLYKLSDAHASPVELRLPLANFVEKNWLLFEHQAPNSDDTELLALYSVEPHVVLKVNTTSGQCTESARSSNRELFRPLLGQLQLHYGAGPIPVTACGGTYYLAIFHTKAADYRYENYFYLFSQHSPFRIVSIASGPIPLLAIRGIALATGLLWQGSDVLIWYGSGDEQARVHTMTIDEVLSSLSCPADTISNKGYTNAAAAEAVRHISKLHTQIHWNTESTIFQDTRVYNPSVLPLPPGSRFPFVAVARMDAEPFYLVGDSASKRFASYRSTIVSCFLDQHFSCARAPLIQKRLYVPWATVQHRREHPSNTIKWRYDEYVGAEDPRLFWTSDGAPLMLYGLNSQDTRLSRQQWIIDLRELLPELRAVLPPSYMHAPIRFRGTELRYAHALEVEKNWIPLPSFDYDSLLLSYTIDPHKLLRVALPPDGSFVREVEVQPFNFAPDELVYNNSSRSSLCFQSLFGTTRRYQSLSLNQGSNALLFKDADGTTRYLAVFHTRSRDPPMEFENFIVLLEATGSRRIVSVSSRPWLPAIYSDESFIYVTSIAYVNGNGDKIGDLNSTILVSIGGSDVRSFVFTTTISELVQDHLLCVK